METLPVELQERIWKIYMSAYVIPRLVHQVIDCDIEHQPDGICPILGDISARSLCPTQSSFARCAWCLWDWIWETWSAPLPDTRTGKYGLWSETNVYEDVCDIVVDVRNLEPEAVLMLIRGFNLYGAPKTNFFSRIVRNVKLHRFPDGKNHWITCDFHPIVTHIIEKSETFTCRFEPYTNMHDLDNTIIHIHVGSHSRLMHLRYEDAAKYPPKERFDTLLH